MGAVGFVAFVAFSLSHCLPPRSRFRRSTAESLAWGGRAAALGGGRDFEHALLASQNHIVLNPDALAKCRERHEKEISSSCRMFGS